MHVMHVYKDEHNLLELQDVADDVAGSNEHCWGVFGELWVNWHSWEYFPMITLGTKLTCKVCSIMIHYAVALLYILVHDCSYEHCMSIAFTFLFHEVEPAGLNDLSICYKFIGIFRNAIHVIVTVLLCQHDLEMCSKWSFCKEKIEKFSPGEVSPGPPLTLSRTTFKLLPTALLRLRKVVNSAICRLCTTAAVILRLPAQSGIRRLRGAICRLHKSSDCAEHQYIQYWPISRLIIYLSPPKPLLLHQLST